MFNLYENIYDRTRKKSSFNTDDSLIEVTASADLTVYRGGSRGGGDAFGATPLKLEKI